MRDKILVTGGTVFVSKYVASYFVKKGEDVYVLNRNTRPQIDGVTLLECDRENPGEILKGLSFDAVIDVNAYTKRDVQILVESLGQVKDYIFISTGAAYDYELEQPFWEEQKCHGNHLWGTYGSDKVEAENYLKEHLSQAYILRPPYLYGPMENLYREPFVFECAEKKRPFCLPKGLELPLQFFHVEDLCRFIECLLEKHPEQRVFNVGNQGTISARDWVSLCYEVVGEKADIREIGEEHQIRDYFCFSDFTFELQVKKQCQWMAGEKELKEGLKESYEWYLAHKEEVKRRPYLAYIDRENLTAR